MNDAVIINKSDFADVPIESFRGNFRYNVAVVYNPVSLNVISVPEITVTDSWRADRINTGGIWAAVSRQRSQGRTQAVAALPDFKTLPVKFIDVHG